jgi:hypothetical protein
MAISEKWMKASKSMAGNECVEVRQEPASGLIEVRNSKAQTAGTASFTVAEWDAFLDGAKAGEFDL